MYKLTFINRTAQVAVSVVSYVLIIAYLLYRIGKLKTNI